MCHVPRNRTVGRDQGQSVVLGGAVQVVERRPIGSVLTSFGRGRRSRRGSTSRRRRADHHLVDGGHLVDDLTLRRRDEDGVVGPELVEIVERPAVGGPTPDYDAVAGLAGGGGSRDVAGTHLGLAHTRAFDDDLLQVQRVDLHDADG